MMTRPISAWMLGIAPSQGAHPRNTAGAGVLLALAGLAVGVVGVGGLGGCAWSSNDEKARPQVTAQSFRSGPAPVAPVATAAAGDQGAPATADKPFDGGQAAAAKPAAAPSSAAQRPVVASGKVPPAPLPPTVIDGHRVVSVVDQPPRALAESSPRGRDVLADCMVGQINGRPVFASEVLDPMDGQLHTWAEGVKTPETVRKWIANSSELINNKVKSRVRDELILAEARARLTPEQKQGLIYFLQRIDQMVSGQQGGSSVEAESVIEAKYGESYDKFLQSQRDQILIRDIIKENVAPAVRVPWRKVERFYVENADSINPPAQAVVRIVMVYAADAAVVQRVQAASTDSAAFAEIAASPVNQFPTVDALTGKKIEGGLLARYLSVPYAQVQWVGNEAWNKAASTLAPGQATGPIETGELKVWIRREADVEFPHRTLEEAQLDLLTLLLRQKENAEYTEFLSQLLGKGSFTPIGRMTLELLVLAAQRHLPPEISAVVRTIAERESNLIGGDKAPAIERAPALPVFNDVSVNPPKRSGTPAAPAPPPAVPPAVPAATPSGVPKP